jgi:hypothetical protein
VRSIQERIYLFYPNRSGITVDLTTAASAPPPTGTPFGRPSAGAAEAEEEEEKEEEAPRETLKFVIKTDEHFPHILLKCHPDHTVLRVKVEIAAALNAYPRPAFYPAWPMPLDADLIVLRKRESSRTHFGYANSMELYRDLKRLYMEVSFPDFAPPVFQQGRTEQDTLWYEPNATPDHTATEVETTPAEPPTTTDDANREVEVHAEVAEDSDSEPDAEGIKDFLAVFES